MMQQKKKSNLDDIPFEEIVKAFMDDSQMLPPAYIYRLSNLDPKDLELVKASWHSVPVARRRAMLADIETFSDADPLLDFSEFCTFTIRDKDPHVRKLSIQAMWVEDSARYGRLLLSSLERERDGEVRASAISALGNYVFYGELGEIPESLFTDITQFLLKVYASDEPALVRRRALESLGFSSLDDIDQYIRDSFEEEDDGWKASALVAMGRSNNPEWADEVFKMLDDDSPMIREEAVRAAGNLEMKKARSKLIKMLEDEDAGVRAAAIWSLSNIGGRGVPEALEQMMDETEDDEELELLEAAMDNLGFVTSMDSFMMIDYSKDDINDSMYEFDPEDDED